MTLAYTLYENGIDPYKDVTIDTSIAFSSMSGAFISGTGDYVTLFELSVREWSHQLKNYKSIIIDKNNNSLGNTPYIF